MLPKKPRHLLYALLLIAISVASTSAIANTRVYEFIAEITTVLEEKSKAVLADTETDANAAPSIEVNSKGSNAHAPVAAMFATPIQDYDDVATCTNNGFTIARFILCGDSDNRTITVAGNASYTLYELTGSTPDTNAECPDTNLGNYTSIYTGTGYNLLATSVPQATGAEYFLQVGGSGPRYYIEVTKSTITQTFTKQDFVCNNPGRIEITG